MLRPSHSVRNPGTTAIVALVSATSTARISPSRPGVGPIDSAPGRAPVARREVAPHGNRVLVEAPSLERDEGVGRRRREQQVDSRRIDAELELLRQFCPQPAIEHPVPGAYHGVGVGERAHVDGRPGQCDPNLGAVRNREHETVLGFDRARPTGRTQRD